MSKYRNVKTEVDGIVFDSKKEAARYGELKLLAKVGRIINLELQPKFHIVINGQKICSYIADFAYHNTETAEPVVEDVKGMKTSVYKLKKKLIKALYGIEVQEVK